METTQTNTEAPSFEMIRAILQDLAERQKETDRQFKEEINELHRETAKLQKENAERQKENAERQKENERQMKESADRLDRQLGKLGNRFGEMVEYMVMPNLVKKFRELGFGFTIASPHATIEDEENNIFLEIDIKLENGDKVMIVEVKSKPTTEDITEHVERMRKIRTHADLHGHEKQIFMGAVAGMIMNNNVRDFALKNGFYAIEPSGETFAITVPAGIYSPKEW